MLCLKPLQVKPCQSRKQRVSWLSSIGSCASSLMEDANSAVAEAFRSVSSVLVAVFNPATFAAVVFLTARPTRLTI